MLPLKTALRGPRPLARARCASHLPSSVRSLSLRTGLAPRSASISPAAVGGALPLAAARSLHASTARRKEDKKWINPSSEGAGAAEKGQDDAGKSADSEKTSGDGASTPKDAVEEAEVGREKEGETRSARSVGHGSGSEGAEGPQSNGAPASAGSSSSSGSGSGSGSAGAPGDAPPSNKPGKEVAKVSIPEVYPQVLALPITRRPLFPGTSRPTPSARLSDPPHRSQAFTRP